MTAKKKSTAPMTDRSRLLSPVVRQLGLHWGLASFSTMEAILISTNCQQAEPERFTRAPSLKLSLTGSGGTALASERVAAKEMGWSVNTFRRRATAPLASTAVQGPKIP